MSTTTFISLIEQVTFPGQNRMAAFKVSSAAGLPLSWEQFKRIWPMCHRSS